MEDACTWLAGTDAFPARWHCGDWAPWLGYLHIASDIVIFVAYALISAALYVLVRRLPPNTYDKARLAIIAGVAFVATCGVSHLLDAVTFYVPLYRVSGPWKALTATISACAAVTFGRLLPDAAALRSETQFQDELAELTGALTQEKDAAETAQRHIQEQVGQVARVFAHDLLQPVRGISSLVGLLTHRGGRMSAEQRDALMDKIAASADRAVRMVEDLHGYATAIHSPGDAPRITIDDLIRRTRHFHYGHPEEIHAKVTVYASASDEVAEMTVGVDIMRVIGNLIDNAIKYRSGDQANIDVELIATHDKLEVSVTDDGMGFDPANAERIFRPFHQLDPHKSKASGGTGMGLAFCQGIVTRVGGTISAHSEGEGKGACFRFDVPLAMP